MERTEIIKALECCTSGNSVSACMRGCPLYEKEDCECINDDTALLKYALSLIKELTEENEKWRTEAENQSILWKQYFKSIYETAKETVIADTVRDYREQLHRAFAHSDSKDKFNKGVFLEMVDIIAEEVIGG